MRSVNSSSLSWELPCGRQKPGLLPRAPSSPPGKPLVADLGGWGAGSEGECTWGGRASSAGSSWGARPKQERGGHLGAPAAPRGFAWSLLAAGSPPGKWAEGRWFCVEILRGLEGHIVASRWQ